LSWCREFFPRGVKQPGGEVGLSHPSSAEVRNDWSNDSYPLWLLGLYKDIFTLFTITGSINLFITKSKQAYCNLDVNFTIWWKKLSFYFLSYCFREVRFEEEWDMCNQWSKNWAVGLYIILKLFGSV
jgi:hypothetical protein